MAWLIVCPHHKTGIFGLLLFFFLLFHQPTLHGTNEQNNYLKRSLIFLKRKLKKSSIYVGSYINLEINLITFVSVASHPRNPSMFELTFTNICLSSSFSFCVKQLNTFLTNICICL
jgi:hypothetical protein